MKNYCFPIYALHQITARPGSGDEGNEDFVEFLQELVNTSHFQENQKAEGIVQYALKNGTDTLSAKQKFVLDNAIKARIYLACVRCESRISWRDLRFDLEETLCASCRDDWNRMS